MLVVSRSAVEAMVAHCLDGYPLEACGLLAGQPGERTEVERVYPTANSAASARLYTVEPRALLRADRDATGAGLELIGVWHSHTHTEAYPSPTDVAQAPDPAWHYVVVSLRDTEPVLRSYSIVDGKIAEERVVVQ
ncbi:MAG TPA: M67 family metallopeptidase [Acidimicrobiales bacterium]|nr:M67 family metallopeptidase [Acidimicrobiales bacterium]